MIRRVWFNEKRCKTIANKAKKTKRWILGILLGTLAPSLLEICLQVKVFIQAGKRTIRAEQDF